MVKSASRVLDIFEAVASSPQGLRISDLARKLSMPKSSTWNLIRTLRDRGHLEQISEGRFVLGSRLFDVAVCARVDTMLHHVAGPLMESLTAKTGETAFLGILTPDFEILQIHKVVSSHVIRYDSDLGQPRPAHCTASGKSLLAHLPPEKLAYYLRTKKLKRFTEKTITDREGLLAELKQVRRSGVAFNIEERVPGVSAIGAPIFAGSERVIAAIIVAGPTSRLLPRRDELARQVKGVAAQISATLGGVATLRSHEAGPWQFRVEEPTEKPNQKRVRMARTQGPTP